MSARLRRRGRAPSAPGAARLGAARPGAAARLGITALVAIALLGAAGCGGSSDATRDATAPPVARAPAGEHLVDVARAGALAVTPGGTLLAGALQSATIVARPARATPLPRLRVATGGQRGLLGLAAAGGGRIFAAYTRAGDGRIVVERIAPGARRRVWTGPPSTTLANGGHLALAPDGRLVIGIGDLQDPARVADPSTPNGKLLALRPTGPNRAPEVLSSGWNNPFAFAFAPDGRLWVADNAPGRRPERIARGDARGGPPAEVTELEEEIAPSGVAAISSTELAVCGFVSRALQRYRLRGGRWRPAGTIARGCRYGVVGLPDGRLAFSTGRDVRTVAAR